MADIRQNVNLAPYTTFNLGGSAKFFVEVKSLADLQEALQFAQKDSLDVFVLSGGSNVLVSDNGFDGLIILNKIKSSIKLQGKTLFSRKTIVRADAGVPLKNFLEFLALNELTGYENLNGIPGSIAGAIRGNAGAFGSEIKDHILSVVALDTESGKLHQFSKKELAFKYRDSFFKQNPNWFILSADFAFKNDEADKIRMRMSTILRERNKRQLQNIQSAGSFFKNPVVPKQVVELFEKEKNTKSKAGRVPAGWLIEKVGLKGYFYKGAKVSDTSANYIINTGAASASSVLELAQKIKQEVKDKFGVTLEEEVQIIL